MNSTKCFCTPPPKKKKKEKTNMQKHVPHCPKHFVNFQIKSPLPIMQNHYFWNATVIYLMYYSCLKNHIQSAVHQFYPRFWTILMKGKWADHYRKSLQLHHLVYLSESNGLSLIRQGMCPLKISSWLVGLMGELCGLLRLFEVAPSSAGDPSFKRPIIFLTSSLRLVSKTEKKSFPLTLHIWWNQRI